MRADPIHAGIIPLLGAMQSDSTNITEAILDDVSKRVCGALKQQVPIYACPV